MEALGAIEEVALPVMLHANLRGQKLLISLIVKF